MLRHCVPFVGLGKGLGGEISIAAEAKQVKWHLKAVSLLTKRIGKATFENTVSQRFY